MFLGAHNHTETCALVEATLRSENPPSAILAFDSQIELGVFELARDLGLLVPRDLSLITFHNSDWTRVTHPPDHRDRPASLSIAKFGSVSDDRSIAGQLGTATRHWSDIDACRAGIRRRGACVC